MFFFLFSSPLIVVSLMCFFPLSIDCCVFNVSLAIAVLPKTLRAPMGLGFAGILCIIVIVLQTALRGLGKTTTTLRQLTDYVLESLTVELLVMMHDTAERKKGRKEEIEKEREKKKRKKREREETKKKEKEKKKKKEKKKNEKKKAEKGTKKEESNKQTKQNKRKKGKRH